MHDQPPLNACPARSAATVSDVLFQLAVREVRQLFRHFAPKNLLHPVARDGAELADGALRGDDDKASEFVAFERFFDGLRNGTHEIVLFEFARIVFRLISMTRAAARTGKGAPGAIRFDVAPVVVEAGFDVFQNRNQLSVRRLILEEAGMGGVENGDERAVIVHWGSPLWNITPCCVAAFPSDGIMAASSGGSR